MLKPERKEQLFTHKGGPHKIISIFTRNLEGIKRVIWYMHSVERKKHKLRILYIWQTVLQKERLSQKNKSWGCSSRLDQTVGKGKYTNKERIQYYSNGGG